MTMECWSCPFSERINGLIGQRVCRELGGLRQKNEGCDLFDAIKTGDRFKFDLIKSMNISDFLQVCLAESDMSVSIPISDINITINDDDDDKPAKAIDEIIKGNGTWIITVINDVDDLRTGDYIDGYEIIEIWHELDSKGNRILERAVLIKNGLAYLWKRNDLLQLPKRRMIRKPQ